jgi:hypothetical protein
LTQFVDLIDVEVHGVLARRLTHHCFRCTIISGILGRILPSSTRLIFCHR